MSLQLQAAECTVWDSDPEFSGQEPERLADCLSETFQAFTWLSSLHALSLLYRRTVAPSELPLVESNRRALSTVRLRDQQLRGMPLADEGIDGER